MDLNIALGTDERGREVAQLVITTPPIDSRELLRMIKREQPQAWKDVERELILPANVNGSNQQQPEKK
jgi:hypothetical protein